ncbi:Phosphocarrier protein HPr /PTS system D-fructose-specific IIA component (F1P-forming), Frc family [Aeromonas sp. RU39B]|jgi:phosphocarrier protein FPr|uniref:fused PTS fructose transporter subunit IIA/HPr protein n=1 Tax=Aeromonas sp. RU39B TaxID=1907416 RepID=UPI000954FE12|nr:fused PTS fructose transporter subunit IIA/HPr protein [Aeromonas sp. RU39B]SIR35383.1 Phosphocarrier protein HPr /PTS system D-fructose-specific IIA component (F1P-forming), Frc family [Aeromonas sp. RU39B]
MLTLAPEQILLGQRAANKGEAIAMLAGRLEAAGLVEAGYLAGMQAREAQHATYLGNGIAIPHGTTDTRHLVRQTGVQVAQFPEGVEWDDGQKAYLVIAIAAKSDEHLGILRQLTHVLGDEQAADRLRSTQDVNDIVRVLSGEAVAAEQAFLALPRFPAQSRDELVLAAAARAKSAGLIDAASVADVLEQAPFHLGAGVWLSRTHANQPGWVLASAEQTQDNASAVLLLCAKGQGHEAQLERLLDLMAAGRIAELAADNGLSLLQAKATAAAESAAPAAADGVSATFTIINPHGLHARPGAVLVKAAKNYEADIRVANLDGNGEEVSAKSLMKVIGMGVKCGHRLAFRASGADAEAALQGIGEAIAAGLGEGAAE